MYLADKNMQQIPELYKPLRIQFIKEEIRDFKVFVFENAESIQYKAGQYITLIHSLRENEVRRSYSITSTPGLNESLSIGVKRIPNGFFSRLLVDHAEAGDELLTSGAGGLFILPDDVNTHEQIFFFAAGSGITPIYSLIKSALHFHAYLKIILIYSSPSPQTAIFREEIQQLEEKFSERFTVAWLFSNSAYLESARLHRDALIGIVKNFAVASFQRLLFYVCGPLSYMRMCSFVLQEMDVPSDNIKKENFLIAQPRPFQTLPPDTKTHYATIHFGADNFEVPVEYPDSILNAARKRGIALPYSCETGRCGNCLAHCNSGTVWLSYNEVLTDKDLMRGFTLTCVGHPVGGDVDITIA